VVPLEGVTVVVTVDAVVLIMDLIKKVEVQQGHGVPTLTTAHEAGEYDDLQDLIKTDHHVVVVEVTMMKHSFQGICLINSPQHSVQYFDGEGMRITLMVLVFNIIISHMIAQLGVFSRTSRLLLPDPHLTEMEILIVPLLCQQAHILVEAHTPPKVEDEVPS
jgi:hypothetical protein